MKFSRLILTLVLCTLGTAAFAQDGCTDNTACNYDPTAAVDDDSCVFIDWYIPSDPDASSSEPAVFTCDPPAGYVSAPNWPCIESIIGAYPDCVNVDWDMVCNTDYCVCSGGYGCTDPLACNFNPAAACDDGSCIPFLCNDPSACNFSPGSEFDPCASALACQYSQLYVAPDLTLTLPAVESCVSPGPDYIVVPNQQCLDDVIAFDPFCITNSFDQVCLDAYCDCAERGCLDPTACNYDAGTDMLCNDPSLCIYSYWQVPLDPTDGLPPLQACSPPSGYITPNDQACAQTIIDNPAFFTGIWDNVAADGYCLCAVADGCNDPSACNYDPAALCDDGSCVYGSPEYYLPITWWIENDEPAILSCTPPEGYQLADCQGCLYTMDILGTLSSVDWDLAQAEIYCFTASELGFTEVFDDCVGCMDPLACNYDNHHIYDGFDCIYPLPECGDPAACNYQPGEFCPDNAYCEYCTGWVIPITLGSAQPAINLASGPIPAGYYLAYNQECLQSVVEADPYCVVTNWDQICLDAYNLCAGAGCTDPFACNYAPEAGYDDGSCSYDVYQWYLPLDHTSSSSEPALFTCGSVPGYALAESQTCADFIVQNFPYSQYFDWTDEAEQLYVECAQIGCTDATAENYDPDALIDDGNCAYSYWYLPAIEGLGPAVYTTQAPPGYFLADQICMDAIGPPLECQYFDWFSCQVDYACCVNPSALGCTDPLAINFSSAACMDDGNCIYAGCTEPSACNFLAIAQIDDGSCSHVHYAIPSPASGLSPSVSCVVPAGYETIDFACFQAVLAQDASCSASWTAACEVIKGCVCDVIPGCMDPLACNYDPLATCDSGCLTKGCSYSNALNYNPAAGCDDGTCEFSDACPTDLDHDCTTSTGDLLIILGAFGSPCANCD